MKDHPTSEPKEQHAILISCIDARLLDETVVFMNSQKLNNKYYHLTLAGCSLDQIKHEHYIKDQVELIIDILGSKGHNLDFVYILEHRDCAAYAKVFPKIKPNTLKETQVHKKYAGELEKKVKKWTKAKKQTPIIKSFIMKDARKQHLADAL